MHPKSTTSSRESRNNLYIAIGAIAGVILISGITTASLLISNGTAEISNAQKNDFSVSSYFSSENIQSSNTNSDLALLLGSLPINQSSSTSISLPSNASRQAQSATSQAPTPSTAIPSRNNVKSSNPSLITNQIPGTKALDPSTVTKEEYKEVTGQDAPVVEVKKDPQATVTEKTITLTYSLRDDSDMNMDNALLTINLAPELKVKPGSITDTLRGTTLTLPDSIVSSDNQIVFGPGNGNSTPGQIMKGQRGQSKLTLLVSSELPTGSYKITSALKDLNDNRELANTTAVYFLEIS